MNMVALYSQSYRALSFSNGSVDAGTGKTSFRQWRKLMIEPPISSTANITAMTTVIASMSVHSFASFWAFSALSFSRFMMGSHSCSAL